MGFPFVITLYHFLIGSKSASHKTYVGAPDELKRLYLGLFWERFEAKERKIVLAELTEIIKAMIKEQLVLVKNSALLKTQKPQSVITEANVLMTASSIIPLDSTISPQAEVMLRKTGSLGLIRKINFSVSPSLPVIITNFRGRKLDAIRTCWEDVFGFKFACAAHW